MLFRRRKKKFTQINTFQDHTSGWDSGLVRPQRRPAKDEMYLITFEMMKKGAVHNRGGKQVRQFGAMVGTDLKLVTSGDFVDRETYEALLAVDAIEAPNHQMDIPGIPGEQPAPPPRPVVPEAIQHVNPVHHEVVGMASVRPMRRKTDTQEPVPAPAQATPHTQPPAQNRQDIPLPQKLTPLRHGERTQPEDAPLAPVGEMPDEAQLEALDEQLPPVEMPEDRVSPPLAAAEEDGLPPADLPTGVDMEADGDRGETAVPPEKSAHVQTELEGLLDETAPTPKPVQENQGRKGAPPKKKRGKRNKR